MIKNVKKKKNFKNYKITIPTILQKNVSYVIIHHNIDFISIYRPALITCHIVTPLDVS